MQKAEFPGHCEVVTVKVETLSAPFVLPFPVLFLLHKYTVHLVVDSYESMYYESYKCITILDHEHLSFLSNVSVIPFFVFGFWSLLATKIRKYYVIFVYNLQGKMGKTEKREIESRN